MKIFIKSVIATYRISSGKIVNSRSYLFDIRMSVKKVLLTCIAELITQYLDTLIFIDHLINSSIHGQ